LPILVSGGLLDARKATLAALMSSSSGSMHWKSALLKRSAAPRHFARAGPRPYAGHDT
jgi:hypothetical protein